MKPMFLPRGVNVESLAPNFEHLQLIDLLKHERDTCVQVYGFPPEMIGIINESKRSTIVAADYHFARWVLTPRLELQRSHLQERLVPDYDDNLILHYVSPIEEDHEFQAKVMKDTAWAFYTDEHRALAGKGPLPDGQGQVRMLPINLFESNGASTADRTLVPRRINLELLNLEELRNLRQLTEKAEGPMPHALIATTCMA